MAFTSAQLNAAINISQIQFALTNVVAGSTGNPLPAVGAPPLSIGVPLLVDAEMMYVVSQPVLNTVIVRMRGSDGTAPSAHDVLANVYLASSATDFGAIAPGSQSIIDPTDDTVISIGQDGAIPLPVSNSAYNINKATAAALTLAAPSLMLNGVTAVITSQTTAAHVITATSLLNDGSAGAPKTTATFVAGKGASITLMAENGLWSVTALQNVTVS